MLLVSSNNEQDVSKHTSLIQVYGNNKRVAFRESSYMNEDDLTSRQGHSLKKHSSNSQIKDQNTNITETETERSHNEHKSIISSNMFHWNSRNITKIGPGLVNLGNTCFLNSVLQCLTYIPPLSNYLLSQEHEKSCQIKTICILCEIQRHIRTCFSHSNTQPICPKGIVSNLKCIAKHFRFGRQEDAHEFLRFLLEVMQRNEKFTEKQISNTIIHQIFGGEFQSKVTCPKCLYASCTIDAFMDVCLDIKHVSSLDKAFQLFVSPEKLTKDNSYRCSKCNHMVNAEKRLSIHRPPVALTIQLKRFTYNPHGIGDTKLNKILSFPETLNLSPYMSDTGSSNHEYQLQSVLVHSGLSCHSGHYYSFVKGPNDVWYSMNDSFVHPVGINTVLRQPAYLLFYIQKIKQEIDSFPVNNTVENHTPTGHRKFSKISSWIEQPRIMVTEKAIFSQDKDSKECDNKPNELDKSLDKYDMEYDAGRVKKIKRRHKKKTKSNPFQNMTEMMGILKNPRKDTLSNECIYFN